MSISLQEPLSVLCDEVGVPMPHPDARGTYSIVIEGQELRVQTVNPDRAVIIGVICHAESVAESRRVPVQALLLECLALAAARFAKLGTREVLCLEPETGELILWKQIDNPGASLPAFLGTAESLLNELEFWKNWLAAS